MINSDKIQWLKKTKIEIDNKLAKNEFQKTYWNSWIIYKK